MKVINFLFLFHSPILFHFYKKRRDQKAKEKKVYFWQCLGYTRRSSKANEFHSWIVVYIAFAYSFFPLQQNARIKEAMSCALTGSQITGKNSTDQLCMSESTKLDFLFLPVSRFHYYFEVYYV